MTNLLDLPELTFSELLKRLGYKSILTLRKVNYGLRSFVDGEKLESEIEGISIFFIAGSIQLDFDIGKGNADKIFYKDSNDDKTTVSVKKSGNETTNGKEKVVDMNYLETFSNDLEIILRQKATLKHFHVFYLKREDEDHIVVPLLTALKNMLDSRSCPIEAESFIMSLPEESHTMHILPYLSSKTLRKLQFQRIWKEDTDIDIEIDLDEVVQSKQWQHVESFDTYGYYVNKPLHHFVHISDLSTKMKTVTTQHMVFLKESIMSTPTPKSYRLEYETFEDKDRLEGIFGPSTAGRTDDEKIWEFEVPGNKKLGGKITWNNKYISIECLTLS